jgi:hypothetical protein
MPSFWDTKTQLVSHRKHYVSVTEPSQLILCNIRDFHGGMKNVILREVVFEGTDVSEESIASIISVLHSLVTLNVIPSSLIHFTLMAEVIRFSETSILTRATRRHIPEIGILHSHRSENYKVYITFYLCTMYVTKAAATAQMKL